MKKTIIVVLCVILCLSILTGCSAKIKDEKNIKAGEAALNVIDLYLNGTYDADTAKTMLEAIGDEIYSGREEAGSDAMNAIALQAAITRTESNLIVFPDNEKIKKERNEIADIIGK